MAKVMSSIIPGWRERTSDQPPDRNGHPAQAKTTVPSTGPTAPIPGKSSE
jgi:hypothetical protein